MTSSRLSAVWFWIWTVLIVASLAGAVLLVRVLWGKLRTTGRAMTRLADVATLGETATGPVWRQPRPVTAFGDLAAARDYRDERELARFARRGRRLARNRLRWEQWRHFNE